MIVVFAVMRCVADSQIAGEEIEAAAGGEAAVEAGAEVVEDDTSQGLGTKVPTGEAEDDFREIVLLGGVAGVEVEAVVHQDLGRPRRRGPAPRHAAAAARAAVAAAAADPALQAGPRVEWVSRHHGTYIR